MAQAKHQHDEFLSSQFVKELIDKHAFKMKGKCFLKWHDFEDLRQDLYLELVRHLPNYDPSRGTLEGFAVQIVHTKKQNAIRSRVALKRRVRKQASLQAPVGKPESKKTDFAALIDVNERLKHHLMWPLDEGKLAKLKSDFAIVAQKLPKTLADLLDRLMTQTPAEIARETGVPESTIYGRVNQLLAIFKKEGLQEYLGDRPIV